MRRPALIACGTVLLGLVIAGGAPAGAAADAGGFPTSAETRAEFEAVCRALTGSDNSYFGQAQVRQLEERLTQPVDDPVIEVLLRTRLANEQIRLGRQREALGQLDRAEAVALEHRLTGDPELRRKLLLGRAIALLFLAEDENCVARHTAASCILPIAAEGVHVQPEHSREAGDLFLEYLRDAPDDIQIRWLLNLSRMVSGDFPDGVPPPVRLPPEALVSEAPFPRWRDVAPELGVAAFDLSGGGVMEDLDGDGLLDLVSSSWDPCEPMKAFRNDGRGGFEDVGAAWGLDAQLGGLNLVPGDYDGDGMVDLLLLRGGWLGEEGRVRNSLLRNDLRRPAGRFVDVTAAAGLAYPAYPTQTAAWADYDLDGDLDLYVGNEATASSTDPLELFGRTGNPYPSQLFRNNGDRTFTDQARAAGVVNRSFAKGVAWGDYDDDGDPDLYVSNIGPNRLYRNNGGGTFTDVAVELGVTEPTAVSFAPWFFDADNDGDLDLLVNDFSVSVPTVSAAYFGFPIDEGHPVLYRNDGGRFTDVSLASGLRRPLLVMGSNYGDLDNDGWLDLYLGTGNPHYSSLMPNVMYRNLGGGRFADVTFAGGFGHLQKGHGVAFGDLDNDGDQDLFEQMGGAFPYDAYGNVLYENPGNGNSWLVLRLQGAGANRFALGARVEVRVTDAAGPRSVHLLAGSGGSFGASSFQQEIGLGAAETIEAIVVRWPTGRRQEFAGPPVNGFYLAVEGEPDLRRLEVPRIELAGGAGGGGTEHRGHGDHGHRHGPPGIGPEDGGGTAAAEPLSAAQPPTQRFQVGDSR